MYGMKVYFDVLKQSFYKLQQGKGEIVLVFITRLEGTLSEQRRLGE